MSFPDHLVASIIQDMSPEEGSVFLDPHCGSGTSLVEAQKSGMKVVGIDANPPSVLSSTVKTNWRIDLNEARDRIRALERDPPADDECTNDPIFSYLTSSGMIERGWIQEDVAKKAIAIKRWIDQSIPPAELYRFFLLGLLTSVVKDVADVKFGPELYCVPQPQEPPDVMTCYTSRLETMVADLENGCLPNKAGRICLGDSRDAITLRSIVGYQERPVYVITSPPYPTEHDYTRNARLELVFLEAVSDGPSLRRIKQRMIRSHSKGIYVGDTDALQVIDFQPVQKIRNEIRDRIGPNSSGFEGQYPKVIANYFGGMLRHFRSLSKLLPAGSKLAYVVGDTASYKSVYIETAQILCQLVDEKVPQLEIDQVVLWRSRRTKKGRSPLEEHVIQLTVR